MKKSIFFAVIITALLTFTTVYSQMNHGKEMPGAGEKNNAASDLKSDMRKLWEEHVVWTRNVIFCIVDELPGTDQAVKRLMQNQTDIGNAVKPFYGDDGGSKLTTLLNEHIIFAADLLKAAKAKDDAAFQTANKKWYDNADEISVFLSSANPAWELNEMKTMMKVRGTVEDFTSNFGMCFINKVVGAFRFSRFFAIFGKGRKLLRLVSHENFHKAKICVKFTQFLQGEFCNQFVTIFSLSTSD